MSRWLLEHRGFLPVPVIITDPAVGNGGGLALAFFHRPADTDATRPGTGGRQQMVAPDTSVSTRPARACRRWRSTTTWMA